MSVGARSLTPAMTDGRAKILHHVDDTRPHAKWACLSKGVFLIYGFFSFFLSLFFHAIGMTKFPSSLLFCWRHRYCIHVYARISHIMFWGREMDGTRRQRGKRKKAKANNSFIFHHPIDEDILTKYTRFSRWRWNTSIIRADVESVHADDDERPLERNKSCCLLYNRKRREKKIVATKNWCIVPYKIYSIMCIRWIDSIDRS